MGEHHRFRFFFAWDFDREEAWINRMSRKKGWQLRRVGFCHYVFDEGTAGEYQYRLELLRRTDRDAAAKHYLLSAGAEEVCRNGEWSYYRLPVSRGPFSAYSCADSKLAYLKKIYPFYLVLGASVYLALAVDLSAFLSRPMTALHAAALAALTLLAFVFTLGLTRFSTVLRRLKRDAAREHRD